MILKILLFKILLLDNRLVVITHADTGYGDD